jgi:hypothetical protein
MRIHILSMILGLALVSGCMRGDAEAKKSQKPTTVVMPAGTQHPALGLAFDLSYEVATDGVIPGYRILTVGVTNSSLSVVQLQPLADEWFVVDRTGKKRRAVLNLRHYDPDVWTHLPQRLKRLIQYPLLVGVGETRAIDLLLPERFPLVDFRGVVFRSRGLGKIIQIYARETTE